jgi:hypothetical protein
MAVREGGSTVRSLRIMTQVWDFSGRPVDTIVDDSATDAFNVLRDWANKAKSATAENPPSLDRFLDPHWPKTARNSILGARHSKLTDKQGRALIDFDVKGKGAIGDKTRHILPAHYVAVAAVDMIPGLPIMMRNENKKPGDDAIFRLNLKLPTKSKQLIAIGRFLYHVPPDAELTELRSGNHYLITAAGSVLTKHRPKTLPLSQDEVLDRIREHIEAAPRISREFTPDAIIERPLAFTANEMIALLTDLLTLNDEWHWDELLGRLDTDPRRRFSDQTSIVPK